jgi:hypothetical protein
MPVLQWDQFGERFYETGVDRGVLYLPNASGVYDTGFAWNGLTAVTESPSGAESNKQYADNQVYVDLRSAEEFAATIEAYTYPTQFAQCDGSRSPYAGVQIGQQLRKPFGLSYRSRIGNDVDGTDKGYKLHLIYNGIASPTERAFGTINDSPEAITFSWEVMTTKVDVGTINSVKFAPTSYIEIDSTKVAGAALTNLENLLYGTAGTTASLPTPQAVAALFSGGAATVVLLTNANAPTFVSGTGVITLPTVTGIKWYIDGVLRNPGAQTAIGTGTTVVVTAVPDAGYVLDPKSDSDWSFTRP